MFYKIVGFSILLAVGYGLIQDQITIRICPEYFTIWHPNPLHIENLTVLALYWGVVATWWMGMIFGCLIGAMATLGDGPSPTFASVRCKLVSVIAFAAICTVVFGLIAKIGGLTFPFIEGSEIAQMGIETQKAFAVDLFAHNAAYDASALGAIVATVMIGIERWRLAMK